jgi:cytochrome P450
MHLLRAKQDTIVPVSSLGLVDDNKKRREMLIPAGTFMFISIRAANRNTAIWGEDAAEWKPARWLSALPGTVTSAGIPGVYSHL